MASERRRRTGTGSSSSSTGGTTLDRRRQERQRIDKMFGRLLEVKGYSPGNPKRTQMMEWSFSKKNRKIQSWKDKGCEPDLESDVFDFLDYFREGNLSVDQIDDLCEKLATADVAWVQTFGDMQGVSYIYDYLTLYVYRARSFRKTQEDIEKLEMTVSCIVEMINNNGAGLKELLAIPHSFKTIVECLSHISTDRKSLVFELLAAVLLISEDSWLPVTTAIHSFCISYPKDFESLMEELRLGDDVDFKIAFLTFVNTMIVQGQSIDLRVRVREDFMNAKITEILDELKSAYADDEDLNEQCIVFDEELENDGLELKENQKHTMKTGGDSGMEPVQIVTALWSKMKGTELEGMFMNILRSLLHLGLSIEIGADCEDLTLPKKVWGIIEKLVKQFDLMGNASGLSYEHVLAAFMKETAHHHNVNISIHENGVAPPPQQEKEKEKETDDDSSLAPAPSPPPMAAPPPPAPPAPFAPPPPGAPPPPAAPGAPPPPGGFPGFGAASFKDPDRIPMLPWRWQTINKHQAANTVFNGLNAMLLIEEGIIDKTELEDVFALKKLQTDLRIPNSGSGAGGGMVEGKEAQPQKKKGPTPTLLDTQRCNIISIVMHHFTHTVEQISNAILTINPDFVSEKTMIELKNVFPIKTYEEEMKKMLEFSGDPETLTEAEKILHGFFTRVPRIREKVCVLLFCEEAKTKLKDCKENVETVRTAFEELHSEKLRSVLEIALAIGNYINNPNQECVGFRLSSLLKLGDVVSKRRPKFSLLHQIAHVIETKFPELLLFPDELSHISEAKSAIDSLQVETSFLKKDFKLLKDELKLVEEEENKTWVGHLSGIKKEVEEAIMFIDSETAEFQKEVLFFGERDANDIGGFFSDWDKFTQSFQTAVRYNITVRRKEEALQKKEAALEKKALLLQKKEAAKARKEEAARKKKEAARRKKEEAVMRRKNKKMKRSGSKKSSQGSGEKQRVTKFTSMLLNDDAAFAYKEKREAAGEEKKVPSMKFDVDSLVDNLLQTTPTRTPRSTREGGTVKQLVASLRTSTKFSKMRDGRANELSDVSLDTETKLVKQVSSRMPKLSPADIALLDEMDF